MRDNKQDVTAQEEPRTFTSSTTHLGERSETHDDKKNKYLLDLRRDTAFKVIFGQKQFLMDLLNSLLIRESKITELVYNPTESLPAYTLGKKVVFDVKCTTEIGEIFIVEMQIAAQDYFKERALYYVSRTIDQQLRKNDEEVGNSKSEEEKKEKVRNYRIEPVYGVFLTCFKLDSEPRMIRDIMLTDRLNDHEPFTDLMRMIFLELPALTKVEECDTDSKKWLYVINNSSTMETIPFAKDKPIFQQLQEKARLHALTPQEQELYEAELRNEIAYYGSIVYAENKARAEGRAEERAKAEAEKLENARKLVQEKGWSIEDAASFFGLSPESIKLN